MTDWITKNEFDGVVVMRNASLAVNSGFPDSNSSWSELASALIENGTIYSEGNSSVRIYYNFSLGKPDGDGGELAREATIVAAEFDAEMRPIPERTFYVYFMEWMYGSNVYRSSAVEIDASRILIHTIDHKRRPLWIDIENSKTTKVESDFVEMRKYWDSLKTLR